MGWPEYADLKKIHLSRLVQLRQKQTNLKNCQRNIKEVSKWVFLFHLVGSR